MVCRGSLKDLRNTGPAKGMIEDITFDFNKVGCRSSLMSTRVPLSVGVIWNCQPPPEPKGTESRVVTVTRPSLPHPSRAGEHPARNRVSGGRRTSASAGGEGRWMRAGRRADSFVTAGHPRSPRTRAVSLSDDLITNGYRPYGVRSICL